MTDQTKILVLTPALPQDSVAGKVVLHRHLTRLKNIAVTYASEDPQCKLLENGIFLAENWLAGRLNQTRLAPWVNDARYGWRSFYDYGGLRRFLERHPQDAMLVMAEGLHWSAAVRYAQMFEVPLIAIFHDWWPDLIDIHTRWKPRIERQFRRLYQNVALAFCVSEGMRAMLGENPRAEVLYPIPDPFLQLVPSEPVKRDRFCVAYAGNLSGLHGQMVRELGAAACESQSFELKIFGGNADWTNAERKRLDECGAYRGYVQRDELRKELLFADALLVTTTHDARHAQWAATNFPSKMVEYCQYGKPIIVWGPHYASAVQWNLSRDAALIVTSQSARDVVSAITWLANNEVERRRLAAKCRELADGMFNPERIQKQFEDGIFKVVERLAISPSAISSTKVG